MKINTSKPTLFGCVVTSVMEYMTCSDILHDFGFDKAEDWGKPDLSSYWGVYIFINTHGEIDWSYQEPYMFIEFKVDTLREGVQELMDNLEEEQ